MAVTGDIFRSLTFDGESSRDYGVYITGQAVYNAPERDVEMVTIPGRNGAFALDKGRFENIEVTYPAGVFANTDTEFAKAISDFRNMLCSRQGYCRLTDEYNPDEYRLAVYKSGLEVDPVQLKAGQFDITFECKPQRYLTSGEEKKVLGTWGDTETKTGEIVELENDGSLAVKSAEVSLEPQQDTSGGVPSPSHICPITGASDVDVNVRGFNQWDEEWELGGFNSTTGEPSTNTAIIRSKNYIPILPNTGYCFHIGSIDVFADLVFYDADKNIVALKMGAGGGVHKNTVFTTPSNASYMRFGMPSLYGNTYKNDICINLSKTTGSPKNGDYVPYNSDSDTYTTSLGTTVYGGSIDVVAGAGTVTYASVLLKDLSIGGSGSSYFYGSINGKAAGNFNIISDAYNTTSETSVTTMDNGEIKGHASTNSIYIKDNRYSTPAELKAAMGDTQIVYELATPTTLTLTPTTVNLIEGTNYVFSPQGEITLEYGTNPNYIVNPTLFGCGPLIEAKGYGDISFNGHTIKLANGAIGTVNLWQETRGGTFNGSITKTFVTGQFEPTDTFSFTVTHMFTLSEVNPSITNTNANATNSRDIGVGWEITYRIDLPCTFTVGTTGQITNTSTYDFGAGKKVISDMDVSYDSTTGTVVYTVATTTQGQPSFEGTKHGFSISECNAVSTLNRLGDPTYIDCDLGEAYKINDGKPVGLNSFVDLGSKLPELAPGINEFTVSNTFTEVAVVPRWWRI